MYINTFSCCGNLTADPDLLQYGKNSYVKFTIALNKPRQNKPMYLDCIAWANLSSSIAEFCAKGQEVYLCGELDIGSYIDSNNITRKSISLKVKEFSIGRTSRTNPNPTICLPKPRRPYISQDREKLS